MIEPHGCSEWHVNYHKHCHRVESSLHTLSNITSSDHDIKWQMTVKMSPKQFDQVICVLSFISLWLHCVHIKLCLMHFTVGICCLCQCILQTWKAFKKIYSPCKDYDHSNSTKKTLYGLLLVLHKKETETVRKENVLPLDQMLIIYGVKSVVSEMRTSLTFWKWKKAEWFFLNRLQSS